MREYTKSEIAIANIPYVAMILMGAVTIACAHGLSVFGLAVACGYLAYGVIGALWIMFFVCPYCRYYATTGCPCGYGTLSAKIVKKGDRDCFSEKFKRHIPVIIPLWIIPAVWGGIKLWQSPSWWLLLLVLAFAVESWVILPIVSKKHGCVECPQKDQCPWMTTGSKTPNEKSSDYKMHKMLKEEFLSKASDTRNS